MAFLGAFHPLLVHLPIGILLLAIALDLWTAKKPQHIFRLSISVMYFCGAMTAILSCITGYLLFHAGDYSGELGSRHQWMGIATAVLSTLVWYFSKKKHRPLGQVLPWILLLILIITGHLGGSLTHGEGYLLTSAPAGMKQLFGVEAFESKKPVIANVQAALAYQDLAAVIFQDKCVNCHGPNKQKGGLRLDQPEWITKGGKNGKVLVAGSVEESELFKRLMLPLNDDDHMPPKEKKQLDKNELALLHWWISEGGEFSKKVSQLKANDTIQRMLKSFEHNVQIRESAQEQVLPEPATSADSKTLQALRSAGVIVLPIASASNNLQVNFLNCRSNTDSLMPIIASLAPQLIVLNLSDKPLTDKGLNQINACHRLQKLYLSNTKITDQGLHALKELRQLKYLNLSNTKVSIQGIAAVDGLDQLQALYVSGIELKQGNWLSLQKKFPGARIDSGGYRLSQEASDTETVKEVRK